MSPSARQRGESTIVCKATPRSRLSSYVFQLLKVGALVPSSCGRLGLSPTPLRKELTRLPNQLERHAKTFPLTLPLSSFHYNAAVRHPRALSLPTSSAHIFASPVGRPVICRIFPTFNDMQSACPSKYSPSYFLTLPSPSDPSHPAEWEQAHADMCTNSVNRP